MALRMDDSLARRLMRPDRSVYIFGAISVFLIGFAFLFALFVNIGVGQETTMSYVDMLMVGFFGSFFFMVILANQRKQQTKRAEAEIFSPLTPDSVTKQFNVVLPLGLMAGVVVVMVNLGVNLGGNLLLGSAFGNIDPTNLMLVLLAGVAEELFFRGFLQTMFEFFLGGTIFARFVAPIPTALIFAWFHFFAYSTNTIAFVVMFAIGLAFGYVQALSRDIGTPMLAHVINNSFAIFPVLIAVIEANLIVFIAMIVIAVMTFIVGISRPRRR